LIQVTRRYSRFLHPSRRDRKFQDDFDAIDVPDERRGAGNQL